MPRLGYVKEEKEEEEDGMSDASSLSRFCFVSPPLAIDSPPLSKPFSILKVNHSCRNEEHAATPGGGPCKRAQKSSLPFAAIIHLKRLVKKAKADRYDHGRRRKKRKPKIVKREGEKEKGTLA